MSARKLSFIQTWLPKLLDAIISIKFFIGVAASVFLAVNKLNQDNWMNLMIFLAGFHTVNTTASIMKGAPAPKINTQGNYDMSDEIKGAINAIKQ